MPARYKYHDAVRNALIKDGWTITHDPFHLLITYGRDLGRRVHYAIAHVDIVGDKLWIRCDTTEEGIATELVALGVPKENIVLGFKSEAMRRDTEFAVA